MDDLGIAALTAPAESVAETAAAGLASRPTPDALSIAAVSHSYGDRRALIDVSLAVPRGGFTALVGLNGAGKTTLFSLITRSVRYPSRSHPGAGL